jgi:hypothetical protein
MTTLTPVQQRTLDVLARNGTPVEFDAALVAELRADLDRGLGELADRIRASTAAPEQSVVVTKHDLGELFGCEAKWSASDDFAWSPARARGQVAHKAIQLLVHWRSEVVPIALVDEAIDRLAGDESTGLARWLANLGPGDAAELRGRAVEHVTKFLECFPRLDPSWWPVTEGSAHYPRDGPILLRARIDLTLGTPRRRESRKVIVDLKTGRLIHRHREDLRFYALVETMVRDVPPRLLASYSLDAASAETEEVTVELLRSTLRRTLDGIERIVEIRFEGRAPARRPGAACRWCPLRSDCRSGQAWLAADARLDD